MTWEGRAKDPCRRAIAQVRYFCAVTWVAVMMPSASAVPCTTTVAPTGMSFAVPVCCTRTAVVDEVFTVIVDPSEPVR